MSYCVNCGVKLSSSEKKCPLCKTPVINPNIKKEQLIINNYPQKMEVFSFDKINWKYIIRLVLLILSVLTLFAVAYNYMISGSLSWSYYVIGSLIYVACHLSFLYFKNIFIPLTIGLFGSELLLLIIAWLNNGLHWYLYLVLPFILIIYFYLVFCVWLFKRKFKSILRFVALCLLFCAATLMLIECLIDLYRTGTTILSWSAYAVLPLALISVILYLLSYNKKLIDKIKRRVFI